MTLASCRLTFIPLQCSARRAPGLLHRSTTLVPAWSTHLFKSSIWACSTRRPASSSFGARPRKPSAAATTPSSHQQQESQQSQDYLIIFQRPRHSSRFFIIACLMIFFSGACLLQADTAWRIRYRKVNQMLHLDIGNAAGLLDSDSSKTPFYVKWFRSQSEISPSDGTVKTFISIYGSSIIFTALSIALLLGTRLVMKHFGVVELGYWPRTGKAKIVTPRWYGLAYQERLFALREAEFLGAHTGKEADKRDLLMHSLNDIAVKVQNDTFYYRLPMESSEVSFDKARLKQMLNQQVGGASRKFKV